MWCNPWSLFLWSGKLDLQLHTYNYHFHQCKTNIKIQMRALGLLFLFQLVSNKLLTLITTQRPLWEGKTMWSFANKWNYPYTWCQWLQNLQKLEKIGIAAFSANSNIVTLLKKWMIVLHICIYTYILYACRYKYIHTSTCTCVHTGAMILVVWGVTWAWLMLNNVECLQPEIRVVCLSKCCKRSQHEYLYECLYQMHKLFLKGINLRKHMTSKVSLYNC